MDLPWGDERTIQFVTNVGLITSRGLYGNNIMACEWTRQVSYSPGLVAINIRSNSATAKNIEETKEFGVNLAASDQNVLASVAGGSSGKERDKINIAKQLRFEFFPAKKISILLVKGSVLNLECKLQRKIELGDHTMYIGEIVEIHFQKGKKPLVYHGLKYWTLSNSIPRPPEKEMARIQEIVEKNPKKL